MTWREMRSRDDWVATVGLWSRDMAGVVLHVTLSLLCCDMAVT